MISNTIYSILNSKPHNSHYLNRYIKYINLCIEANKNIHPDTYLENHHICPKANDLFPEYIDLKLHKWNSAKLTIAQHIYAHIILWKLYGKSQIYALDWMFVKNSNIDEFYLKRKIPSKLKIRYAAKIKIKAKQLLHSKYATPDGIYHGSYLKDDPIITELSLISYRTQAQIDQNASRTQLATEARLGTNIYNNGIEEKFLFEPIDETWVIGRLPRSEEWETKRNNSMRAKVVGANTYTNGLINIFIKDGDVIPEGFRLGMKHRECEHYYTNPNKSEVITFFGSHNIPEGWTKIKTGKAQQLIKHLELINVKLETLDQAKEFVSKCMTSNYITNPNMTSYVKLHEQELRDISGFKTVCHTDLLKCIHNNISPPSCKFCGGECYDLNQTFCSMSCRSKMIKTNTKTARRPL